MVLCSDFIYHLHSVWRRRKFLDWTIFFIACIIFVGGCILTFILWIFEVSLWFVLLYTILGIFGLFLCCITKNEREMSPLLPRSQVNANQQVTHSIERFNVRIIDDIVNSEEKQERNPDVQPNYDSSYVHEDIFTMDPFESEAEVANSSKYPISCVEMTYTPRIAYERLVTGPSPGGGNSKRINDDTQSRSWQRRLSPLLGPFREVPRTEASAQFHVPLSEISLGAEGDTNSSLNPPPVVSEPQSDRDVQAKDHSTGYSTPQVSQQPIYENIIPSEERQQPIYENIIPSEERQQSFLESDMVKFLQYDTPKSLRRVDEKKKNVSPSYEQNVSRSAPGNQGAHNSDRSGRNRGRARLGPFTSFEKTYVNVFSSLEERHEGKIIHKGSSSNDPKQEFHTAKETYSEPLHDHSSLSKTENVPTSRLEGENIYMNALSLTRKSMDETNGRDMDLHTPVSMSSKGENIYMNLPDVVCQGSSFRQQTEKIVCDIQEQSNSENESSIDAKSEYSESNEENDKINIQFRDWIDKKNTNRARSEHMCVTGLGPTFKSIVKQGYQLTNLDPVDDILRKHENISALAASRSGASELNSEQEENAYRTERKFRSKTCSESIIIAPSSSTQANEMSPPSKDDLITQTERLSIDGKFENLSFEELKEYFNTFEIDDINYTDESFEDVTRGEYVSSEAKQVEQIATSKTDGEAVNCSSIDRGFKAEYDNAIYGENVNGSKSFSQEIDKPEENSRKVSKNDQISDNENSLCLGEPLAIKEHDAHSQNKGSLLNETFSVQPQSLSSFSDLTGKSRKLDTPYEAADNQATSSKKESSKQYDDEDFICHSKNSSVRKIDDSSTKDLVKQTNFEEECNITKDNNSPSFSKKSISSSVLQHGTTPESKVQENVFSTNQLPRLVSSRSMNDEFSKLVSFNTPLIVPNLSTSQNSEFKNDVKSPSKSKRSPRIFPPLDGTCTSPTMQDSSQTSNLSSKKLSPPLILNQSSIVQTQIQKFTALNEEANKNSTRSPTKSPLRYSPRSSATSPLLTSKTESTKRDLGLTATLRNPRYELSSTGSGTSEEPSTRFSEGSSNVPSIYDMKMIKNLRNSSIKTTEPNPQASTSKSSDKHPKESSIEPKNPPVYF